MTKRAEKQDNLTRYSCQVLILLAFLLSSCAHHTVYAPVLVDGNLYRSSQLSDFEQFKKAGIGKIINLLPMTEDVAKEAVWANENGVVWHNYPMSDSAFIPPSVTTLNAILADILSDPLPVDVHCLHGSDRTGYVVMWYRIKINHWTVGQALAEADKYGHASVFYILWKPVLKEAVK